MNDDAGQADVVRCFVKGAPDQLLARAARRSVPMATVVPVDARSASRYLAENERLGAQGLRVMATAQRTSTRRRSTRTPTCCRWSTDLPLLALVGIVDPPRAEARDAIATAKAAGIQVRMITGDHAVTAKAIGEPARHRGPGHHRAPSSPR